MKPTIICCFSKNQGGMELMSITLAKMLSADGPVYIACRENSFIHNHAKKYGYIGEIIPFSFKINFSPKFILNFSKILKNLKIQNLIFLGASELKSLYFACLGKKINFCMFHGTTKTHIKKDLIHKILYKIVSTHICISEHIKENIKKILPIHPHTKIAVIYTPREVSFTDHQKPNTRIECLLTARIAKGKGHIDAIKACEEISNKNVILRYVGNAEDTSLLKEIRAQIEKSPIQENIFLYEHTTDLSEFYNKAHILLFPSAGEGLSMSTIEALMSKTLPITYNNTVFPEYLKMGFIFPQAKDQDIKDLSKQLNSVILNYSNWLPAIESNFNLSRKLFSFTVIKKQYLDILN